MSATRPSLPIPSNNSALQELKVYVNGTLRLTSTGIDANWSAGMCGLVMFNDCTSAVQFDNFKVGYDTPTMPTTTPAASAPYIRQRRRQRLFL